MEKLLALWTVGNDVNIAFNAAAFINVQPPTLKLERIVEASTFLNEEQVANILEVPETAPVKLNDGTATREPQALNIEVTSVTRRRSKGGTCVNDEQPANIELELVAFLRSNRGTVRRDMHPLNI